MLSQERATAPNHILDQPVEMAFRSHWRAVARRNGSAWMLPADIGPFAALGGHNVEDDADFSSMIQARSAPVIILQKDPIRIPDGVQCLQQCCGVQMVHEAGPSPLQQDGIENLDADDASEMVALARLTEPGPFEERTYLLGTFLGVRKTGRLIAMAGQRMRVPGWTEISAVCVHPEERNAGLATRLITTMADLITRAGNRPFLHTYANNHGAIALYQKLGFRLRTRMQIAVLTHQ